MQFKPIEFTRDEQAHNTIAEWWYFNSLLKDNAGHEYAYMNSLFKVDAKKVKIPFLSRVPAKIIYFYHALLSDIKAKKSTAVMEFPAIVSADSFAKPLLFINHTSLKVFDGYLNKGIEETEEFAYHLKDKNVDLKLISTKTPLLVGGKGFLNFQTKSTYYYSLTNLKTEGWIKNKDKWIEVSGKSWMDHQWADTAYSKDQWAWFSLQLDNQTEILCFEFIDQGKKNYLASVSYPDGRQEHFTELEIKSLNKSWISPKTKAIYPLEWNIKILGLEADLKIEALINEQEMLFSAINYWEGPISVAGEFAGEKANGQGFMELVGFQGPHANLKERRDELAKTVSKIFSRQKKKL